MPALLLALILPVCMAVWMELDDRAEQRQMAAYVARLEAQGRQLRQRIYELNRGHPARRP